MTDELDLAKIESHPRLPRFVVGQDITTTAPALNRALDERDALLAEVKRLRAQLAAGRAAAQNLAATAPVALAEAWDDGHEAGIDFAYGTYTDNPYRTQPEETP